MNKRRINFTLSDKMYEEMRDIHDKTGLSQSEILRRGLSLLTVASNEKERENFLAVADSSGKVVKHLVVDL